MMSIGHDYSSSFAHRVVVYWMTVITGRFFIASLDNIADKLGLPPDIAGATLMAAGTSARIGDDHDCP